MHLLPDEFEALFFVSNLAVFLI
jgi:uncharacterized protein YoxC